MMVACCFVATDTVYLDFAKAFDKVDHDILCHIVRVGKTGFFGGFSKKWGEVGGG